MHEALGSIASTACKTKQKTFAVEAIRVIPSSSAGLCTLDCVFMSHPNPNLNGDWFQEVGPLGDISVLRGFDNLIIKGLSLPFYHVRIQEEVLSAVRKRTIPTQNLTCFQPL
jgi:hypothetical protein